MLPSTFPYEDNTKVSNDPLPVLFLVCCHYCRDLCSLHVLSLLNYKFESDWSRADRSIISVCQVPVWMRELFWCGWLFVSVQGLMHKQWEESECIMGKASSWDTNAELGCCSWRIEPVEGNYWLKGLHPVCPVVRIPCLKCFSNGKLLFFVQSFASPLNQVQSRIWLMHWSLYIFFNHDNGRTQIIDLFNQDKYGVWNIALQSRFLFSFFVWWQISPGVSLADENLPRRTGNC